VPIDPVVATSPPYGNPHPDNPSPPTRDLDVNRVTGPSAPASVGPPIEAFGLRHVARLVLSNTLMWTTGAATVASMLGLQAVLDPDAPSRVPALGFVEGTLSWIGRCSVPVSLLSLGLFTASRPGCGLADLRSVRTLAAYLAVKLLVVPWVMVFVNSLLGLDGRLAQALVVLTCVPVAQIAYVVAEQHGEGAEEVANVMQAGLLLMLPHLAAVMGLMRWMGLYQGADA
jgi:predicted permease